MKNEIVFSFSIDVPNAPNLKSVTCNKRDASIHWEPMGDNRAPILRYMIQFNTSFTPDTWEIAFDSIPATDMTYTVSLTTCYEAFECHHLRRIAV
jgi:hypothetical protein